ncbi:MAG: hypothetical protein JWN27_1907 [Candidatus Eremiobacteraeota bacterium]|nr:hypothetical protein [Candidatus Eremiobacteraeota bacterium]
MTLLLEPSIVRAGGKPPGAMYDPPTCPKPEDEEEKPEATQVPDASRSSGARSV